MYLDKNTAEDLFNRYSAPESGVISKESFLKLTTEITDESNMLEHPHYVSIPEIRNELGIAMYTSSLIDLYKEGKITADNLLIRLKDSNKELKNSILKLSRRENEIEN